MVLPGITSGPDGLRSWRHDPTATSIDSTTPVGEARAVCVEAIAQQVTDVERADALAVYGARSVVSVLDEDERRGRVR